MIHGKVLSKMIDSNTNNGDRLNLDTTAPEPEHAASENAIVSIDVAKDSSRNAKFYSGGVGSET